MFQNQQNSARGAPLSGNRLQNGKLGKDTPTAAATGSVADEVAYAGSGSQWGFGGPMGAAPGLSNAQPRANGGGLSSFAQTIGGSQTQNPLNLE
jgi:CCR4-NOT transcription complex subunit 2